MPRIFQCRASGKPLSAMIQSGWGVTLHSCAAPDAPVRGVRDVPGRRLAMFCLCCFRAPVVALLPSLSLFCSVPPSYPDGASWLSISFCFLLPSLPSSTLPSLCHPTSLRFSPFALPLSPYPAAAPDSLSLPFFAPGSLRLFLPSPPPCHSRPVALCSVVCSRSSWLFSHSPFAFARPFRWLCWGTHSSSYSLGTHFGML